MPATYFGLVCPTCNGGYPLGLENKRDWRYYMGDWPFAFASARPGSWELTCIRCGAVTTFPRLQSWTPRESYSAAQIATARTHVRRVSPSRT